MSLGRSGFLVLCVIVLSDRGLCVDHSFALFCRPNSGLHLQVSFA